MPLNEPVRQPVYAFEGFRLDTQRRVLFSADGQPIALTPRLFDTLLYFVERSGQLLTKAQLLDDLWPNVVVEEHNLNKTVSELRRALGEKPGEHKFIVTKPGHGYRFVADVTLEARSELANDRDDADAAWPSASTMAARAPPVSPRRRYRAFVAVALLIAAAAVGIALVDNRAFAPADANLRPTIWAREKGGHVRPVWSPDSRATVYAASGGFGEEFQLYIREIGAPAPRSIARRADFPVPVQWTAGGKILFVDAAGLWSMSPTGTAPERIRSFDWTSSAPFGVLLQNALDVSRDGQMAYIGRATDGRAGVLTATLPGGEATWYSPDTFATRDVRASPFLRFSPDGTQLLLWWNAGRGAEEAWLLPFPPDAANPPRRVLEDMPVIFGTPEFSWLPDGRHVVVSAGPERREPGPRELFLADTRSGRFKLLLSGTTAMRYPVVSPAGDAFIYTDFRANYDVVTFDVRTGRVTPVVDSQRWEQMPAWAANAPVLAYITAPNNAPEVWLRQPGQPDQPFATSRHFQGDTTFFEAPAPSPEGAHVIYQRVEGPNAKSSHLWISAVAGGQQERLTTGNDWETGGSWSPDGEWFAYFVQDGGLNVLKKVRTTGQATPQIVLAGEENTKGLFWLPVWSPEGDWILVPDRGILVKPDGSDTRSLGLDLRTQSCWAFAPQGLELYCIEPPQDDGRYPLVVRDLEGRVGRTLGYLTEELIPRATLMPPALRFSPTHDGTGLTYSIAVETTSLWLMEGLADIRLP